VPGVNVCTDCGDGHCDSWESSCNCEWDCPPVVDPNFCFGNNACGPGEYCKFPVGDCGQNGQAGECVIVPEVCSSEPQKVCGCNNMTYQNECFLQQNQVSALHGGQCQPLNCIAEGEAYDASDNTVSCCEGLNPIGLSEPDESGECTGSTTNKKICAFCPDNQCGPGENYCNCPQDCGDEPPQVPCAELGGTCQTPPPGTTGCTAGEEMDDGWCGDDMVCCKLF